MKNKKRNTIITIIILVIIFLIGGIYFILNYSPNENSLTVIEKKWLTDNANKIIDINVYNDIPIYGYNGNGIIFDYLSYLEEQYGIHFNKIPYYTDSKTEIGKIAFITLDNNEKVTSDDLLIAEDHYVVLSADSQETIKLETLEKVGVLTSDSAILKEYLKDSITIEEYENIEALTTAVQNEEITYFILTNISNMDEILTNKFNIVYHIQDLKKKFILRTEDSTVYNIFKKSYLEYSTTTYQEDYSKNYLQLYFQSTNTADLEKKNYNAKTYKYGYVINMPYENNVNNTFVGTLSNYLSDFEKTADVEIEVVQYHSIDDLKSALVSGEVDFAFGNFLYENINMESTTTRAIKDLEYVVLSKQNYSINSIKGLMDKNVSVVNSSILHNLLSQNEVSTKNFANTDELLRNIDDQSIILLDKETYIYYKDSKLKDYQVILENNLENQYKFLLNSENETFNSLFSYYISTIDYQVIKYNYHTDITLDKDYTTLKIIIFIVALILFLISSVILLNRKNVTNTVISKEEKLKYIDPMTSLKNRNYLNTNIYKWDDNVIFPQSVVVLDVNKLREVNDTYGRETGDEIIKKVASVLINSQLENTDIIRSGGDEFLIYMVGYDEKKVAEYTKKLLKSMKEIPDCPGIEVGYSMILDEVKTVDDAINEAITMMTKNKEKKRAKE